MTLADKKQTNQRFSNFL